MDSSDEKVARDLIEKHKDKKIVGKLSEAVGLYDKYKESKDLKEALNDARRLVSSGYGRLGGK